LIAPKYVVQFSIRDFVALVLQIRLQRCWKQRAASKRKETPGWRTPSASRNKTPPKWGLPKI